MGKTRHIGRATTRLMKLLALLLFLYGTASAEDLRHARVRVIAEPWDGQSAIRVIVRFSIDDGWHLYWKNPGDSGLPPDIAWKLPEGFTASPLSFPVPEKMVHEDETAFGYRKEFVLTATITPPKGYQPKGSTMELEADADWLACNDRCVREKQPLACTVPTFDAKAHRDFERLWKQAQRRMPLAMDAGIVQVRSATIVPESPSERVTIVLDTPAHIRDFYPDAMDGSVINLQSVSVRNGTITFLVTPAQSREKSASVSGMLFAGSCAYYCTFTF